MMRRFRVDVHRHMDEIDQVEWDGLMDRENVPSTHRFVALCQDSGVADARYAHVVIRDSGRPVLVATLCRIEVKLDLIAHGGLRGAAAVVRSVWPRFLTVPVLIGGLPASFAQSCLGLAPDTNSGEVLRLLSGVADEVARDFGAGFVAFKEFAPHEVRRLRQMERFGYFLAPSVPTCTLSLRSTFNSYLAEMRSGYRRQLRLTQAKQRELGLRCRLISNFRGDCPTLFRLYQEVMERAPLQLEQLNLEFFEGLAERFADTAHLLVVEHDGRPLAAALLLESATNLNFLVTGLDTGDSLVHQAYLTLMVEVVKEAHRRRKQTLMLGQTSWSSKTRLGARVESRSLFVRHRARPQRRMLHLARHTLFPEFDVGPRRRVFR